MSESFNIPALVNDVIQFFANNEYGDSQNPQADAERCLTNAEVECFRGVEISIPNDDMGEENSYIQKHVRTTGKELWCGINGRADFDCGNVR